MPVLVAGSILAPGRRLVTSALHAMGLAQVPWLQNYHWVLNRAVRSHVTVGRMLGLLVAVFVPSGPLVVALIPQPLLA